MIVDQKERGQSDSSRNSEIARQSWPLLEPSEPLKRNIGIVLTSNSRLSDLSQSKVERITEEDVVILQDMKYGH